MGAGCHPPIHNHIRDGGSAALRNKDLCERYVPRCTEMYKGHFGHGGRKESALYGVLDARESCGSLR